MATKLKTLETHGGLLADVLAFIARWNINEPQFGMLAGKGQAFVNQLRHGRQCKPATERGVREFMARGDPCPKARVSQGPARSKARPVKASRKYVAAIRRNAKDLIDGQQFRFTDPVERAKTYIRAQRFACFEAAITRPELHGNYFIGPNLVDRDGLLNFARKKGWNG